MTICNVPVDEMLNTPSCEICISEICDGMFSVKGELNGISTDVNIYSKSKEDVDNLIDQCLTVGVPFERFCSEMGVLVEANV